MGFWKPGMEWLGDRDSNPNYLIQSQASQGACVASLVHTRRVCPTGKP